MSTTQNVLMNNKSGVMYPYTTVENVVGLQSALAEKADADHTHPNQVQMISGSSLDESTLETGKLYFAYE